MRVDVSDNNFDGSSNKYNKKRKKEKYIIYIYGYLKKFNSKASVDYLRAHLFIFTTSDPHSMECF
ncbi:hypothetical protein LCGC14_1274570 [marine sediment metagenome]|uniref:Uncharacterized protein n=1 Tax=marine sediment metagenome TaxID=412755 RepID=A0A0F9KWZ1_9ZZZZ